MIRVLLVDDHRMVIEGLKAQLAKLENIEIVGEAYDGKEGIRKTKELNPDIVIMDISMPVMNGLEATAILHEEAPDSKVLVLTMHDEEEYILQIIRSGARGYVIKESSFEELIEAIETVHQGRSFFSPSISEYLLSGFIRQVQDESTELTPRELDVLALVADGYTNKEVAKHLHISIRTAESHRNQIMQKLDIHTLPGLTKYAISKGIIELKKGKAGD